MTHKTILPLAVSVCLSAPAIANAAEDVNPFALEPLSTGYQVADRGGTGSEKTKAPAPKSKPAKGDQVSQGKNSDNMCGSDGKCGGSKPAVKKPRP